MLGGVLESFWLVRLPFIYFSICLALYIPLLTVMWSGKLGWRLIFNLAFLGKFDGKLEPELKCSSTSLFQVVHFYILRILHSYSVQIVEEAVEMSPKRQQEEGTKEAIPA